MASMSSESCENVVHDAPEIDSALLMALLEETHVEDAEDERLGCVIRSLEAEIGNSSMVESEGGNYDDCMDCGLENVELMDGGDCSRSSTCQINDPFDWVDMDMVSDSHYDGNWYLETCTNEDGMVGFGDVRDYNSPFYYGDTSIEHDYSPLWQETYDYKMCG